jgi:anti-sigma B factor antagonist
MSDQIISESRTELVRKLGTLTLRSDRDGDVHVIALEGELDLATAPEVEEELKRVEATDAIAIFLDLSRLTFIDSTGIRMMLSANARSRADSDRLSLLRASRAVLRVFEISGVVDLLPLRDSERLDLTLDASHNPTEDEMIDDEAGPGEDALKDADVESGDDPGTPVHSPTIPEDEGNVGDGTGEGDAGPASGTSGTNPAAPEVDHL